MDAQERLRQAIDEAERRLRDGIPGDREAAILAIVRRVDTSPGGTDAAAVPDLVTGHRIADLGGNKALQLRLELSGATGTASPPGMGWEDWAEAFLRACGQLAEAEFVLGHVETGFMRLVDDGHGAFDAWIATKRVPTSWRERADSDWWANWLAGRHEPELRELEVARPGSATGRDGIDAYYGQLADVRLKMMAYQLSYPPEATIGGCTVQTYRDVLRELLARALRARERGDEEAPQSGSRLRAVIARALAIDPALAERGLEGFTLDAENATYHAAVPGVAAAPVVRVSPDEVVLSLHGLTTEPLFFLTRELRRRFTEEYHNAAHLRESVFRQDLYRLFADKRFVTSSGRIELRRAAGGVRTDIDAVVFDRKSGTLGLFELKSQDPFARTTAELARQRDNVLYANRQISSVLDWVNRHGADEILRRVDQRTAKTFRVQKVLPFVLGRYVVHFNDGPEPDRRAAWGTWPQVLQLRNGEPFGARESNPLASLFSRLGTEDPPVHAPSETGSRQVALGTTKLTVYSSFAAFQELTARV
jgi:hypothetical protein